MRSTNNGQNQRAMCMTAVLVLSAAGAGSTAAFAASDITVDNTHQHTQYLDDGAWVNDIGTLLYGDSDGDGYFSGLSLSIDADSNYGSYDVYAIIDISGNLDGSAQYQTERLHTTSNFTVYGRSATDEYRVDIDLVRNYSPGIYDLQVLLVDAHDNRVMDSLDAFEFRNLRSLPLESTDNESIDAPLINSPQNAPNDDIFVTEYAGGSGAAFIALLMMSLLLKIRLRGW